MEACFDGGGALMVLALDFNHRAIMTCPPLQVKYVQRCAEESQKMVNMVEKVR